jgi:hypothetical protein
VAELLAAYSIFQRFAVASGLISQVDSDGCLGRALQILTKLVSEQADGQEETKPGRKFCEYVGAALRAGRLFLRSKRYEDGHPEYPEACGWEKYHLFQGTARSLSGDPQIPMWQKPRNTPCGGYVDDDEKMIYLDFTVAIGIANAWAKQNGDTQVFIKRTLGRDLIHEELCLPFTEGSGGKQRASSNQSIHGSKGYYLRIPRDRIIDPELTIQSRKYPEVDEFTYDGIAEPSA